MVGGRLGCVCRGGALEKQRKLLEHRKVKVSRREDSEETLKLRDDFKGRAVGRR